jgi:cytochrome c oxidase subunit 3
MNSETQITVDSRYDLDTSLLGMWVFIAMETLFFGGALFLYWAERHMYPEVFALGSRHLETGLAGFNTFVLLTSSLSMAASVRFLEDERPRMASRALILTALLGALFLALKGYEYVLDAQHGLLPGVFYHPEFSAPKELYLFFSIYLFLTGLHAVHLIIGVSWCSVVARQVHRSARRSTRGLKSHRAATEVLGLYWHFVDIVWVLLLPLLYLIGA